MRANRIMAGVCVLMGMACGSGDDGGGPPPLDPPVVTSISTTTAAPGDNITITGSNFSTTAAENTVTFSNPLSAIKATTATATQITVVVDKDATDGPITVTTSGGSDTSSESLTVTRGVGDVLVFSGTGANNKLRLPNPTASTQYLVIPHSVNSAVAIDVSYGYIIKSTSPTPLPAPANATSQAPELASQPGHVEANQWFESRRWDDAQHVVDRYGLPPASDGRRAPSEAAAAPAVTRQFYVLKTTAADQDFPSSYAHITATLRYTGTKCLVYADNDTLTGPLASGNFTQAHFDLFGQTYDNSIEATNVTYFGPYSDVDNNGKLIMLISPVVNRLQEPCGTPCACGFIAGFFNPRDLYSNVTAGTANHAEIIYLLAADPAGHWDCQFPVDATAAENLSTIPHEHQHLTSFSWRIFHENGNVQVTWLEEGMAHMAEDLNGDNSSNIGRGKLYRQDPGAISLEDNHAPLEQRGGIYLMLRLLTDRYGTGILKQILQSDLTGRSSIQNVTGIPFYDAMAEFLAAQYLSGEGITADERFNYTSIDINDFGPLLVGNHVAGAGDVNGNVRRASGDFHIFTGVLSQESVFQFEDPTGNVKLRNVIVRLQ